MAIAAGVNLILTPEIHICFTKLQATAPDGRCKTFDSSANGYGRAEGSVSILLKRLSAAEKDGDRILGVVRGSAVNQDGKTSSITVPNGDAQKRCIIEALKNAKLKPEEINYVECHGTGTPLGDPIEINAVAEAFEKKINLQTEKKIILPIGSIKSNIGHTEPVAGLCGVVKILTLLQHKKLAPTVHLKTLNPKVNWEEMDVRPVSELMEWQPTGKRIAGLNSFGFSGTNAHCIIEEPPSNFKSEEINKIKADNYFILPISAKTQNALNDLTKKYIDFLEKHSELNPADLCYTAAAGRKHFESRIAVSGRDINELKLKLKKLLEADNIKPQEKIKIQNKKIVFLYTGQGSQYHNMLKEIYDTNQVFKTEIDRCCKESGKYLEFSLLEVMYGEKYGEELINRTDYAQPAIFAIGCALTELWKSYGIKPSILAGHSIGKITAAYISGIFLFEDAIMLVCCRGKLMHSATGAGEMYELSASEEIVREIIKPYADQVSVATINSPNNIVISGEKNIFDKIKNICDTRKINYKKLKVSHAFHSPLMDCILDEFEKIASEIKYNKPLIPVISDLTGREAVADELTSPKYWRMHLREAVRFSDTIANLENAGYSVFLEIGARAILTYLGTLSSTNSNSIFIASQPKKQEGLKGIYLVLENLYASNIFNNWYNFYQTGKFNKIDLPYYAFQRSEYKLDPMRVNISNSLQNAKINPFIGKRIESPVLKNVITYDTVFNENNPDFAKDHIIFDTVILPGAAHISMILSGMKDIYNEGVFVIEDYNFVLPLTLAEEERHMLLIINKNETPSPVEIYSKLLNDEQDWAKHSYGSIRVDNSISQEKVYLDDIKMKCQKPVSVSDLFDKMKKAGYKLGKRFFRFEEMNQGDNCSLCKLDLKEDSLFSKKYEIHPGLLDTIFQSSLPANDKITENMFVFNKAIVPLNIHQIIFYKKPKSSNELYVFSKINSFNSLFISIDSKVFD